MSTIQYTIRGVPEDLDRRIRQDAHRNGKSMNSELVEALRKGLGMESPARRFNDLDDLAGSWVEDPEFDKAVAEMDRIDPDAWK